MNYNQKTPCKNCAFCIYKHTDNPDELDRPCNQQVDCELGMIEKWKNAGINIIEAYDNDCEFYVIPRYCMYGRSKRWVQRQHSDKFEPIKPAKLYDIIRDEVQIQCEAIIYIDCSTEWNDVQKTIGSLSNQTLKPIHITFLQHPNTKMKPSAYRLYNEHENPIKWSIEMVMDMDCTEGGYNGAVDRDRCVDIAVKGSKNENCLIVNAGYALPLNYIKWIDNLINDDLRPLLAVLPIDEHGNGLFLRKTFHQMIGGNRTRPLIDKVKTFIEEDEECHKMFASYQ